MRPAAFAAVLGVSVAGAMGAVVANFVVGGHLFEEKVVADPYQAGLRYDETRRQAPGVDCDLARGPCRRALPGGSEAVLDVGPRPPRAMVELDWVAEAPGADSGQLSFTMPGMFMGDTRVALRRGPDGKLRGKGLLVRCPSGGRTWSAALATGPGTSAAPLARFTFDLAE